MDGIEKNLLISSLQSFDGSSQSLSTKILPLLVLGMPLAG